MRIDLDRSDPKRFHRFALKTYFLADKFLRADQSNMTVCSIFVSRHSVLASLDYRDGCHNLQPVTGQN